jgi:uncharacterized protein YprB with RNaseH-like and TPR domain
VSFRSKLARLQSLGPPLASSDAPPPPSTGAPDGSSRGLDPQLDPDDARRGKLDELRARMQAILARTASRGPRTPPEVSTPELPFVTEETPLGPLHLRTVRLSASHRTGRAPLLAARTASAELLALLALDATLERCDPARALYLDTETTGLSGGTGTVAFLVGLAFWTDGPSGGLVVEQILVRNLGEEAPMLAHVAKRIAEASMLVTFNGKSFDLPLLRTRFVMARLPLPAEPPHLDLVHVARRLHRPRGIECRLVSIERDILGFERHDDVPSGEVSACYLHFLRTGETRALLGVIEHNAWDVVAMAALVGLYGEPLEGTQLDAADLVGLARTLHRAGEGERALDAVTRAVDAGVGAESLRARAEIAKARGDKARALVDFERLAEQVDCRKTRLELAKLYEHYVREPARALAMIEQGVAEDDASIARRSERLSRKLTRGAGARKRRQPELPGLAHAVAGERAASAADEVGLPPRRAGTKPRDSGDP